MEQKVTASTSQGHPALRLVERKLTKEESERFRQLIAGKQLLQKQFCDKVVKIKEDAATKETTNRQLQYILFGRRKMNSRWASKYATVLEMTLKEFAEEIGISGATVGGKSKSVKGNRRFRRRHSQAVAKAREVRDLRDIYKYRRWDRYADKHEEITYFLAERYDAKPFLCRGQAFPITVLWSTENPSKLAHPIKLEEILGDLDMTRRVPQGISDAERDFIKEDFQKGPIKYEGWNFAMRSFDRTKPLINGCLVRYYDNVLTQMALRWELFRAIDKDLRLNSSDALPRRNAIEDAVGGPENTLCDGSSRAAAMSINTLYVFKRSHGEFSCLVKRRARNVMFPGFYDVIPAGAFECAYNDPKPEWSIEINALRELAEEAFGRENLISPTSFVPESIERVPEVRALRRAFNSKKALLTLTGFAVDLTTLIPEISTVLLIEDAEIFSGIPDHKFEPNWEWEKEASLKTGSGVIPITDVPKFLEENDSSVSLVPSAAMTLELGYRWLKENDKI